jgi:hypothetical protein
MISFRSIPRDQMDAIQGGIWRLAGTLGALLPADDVVGIDRDYAGFRLLHELLLSMAENRAAAIAREYYHEENGR